jgi:3-oxoacyl-(acyl-carrier-protein) synthase
MSETSVYIHDWVIGLPNHVEPLFSLNSYSSLWEGNTLVRQVEENVLDSIRNKIEQSTCPSITASLPLIDLKQKYNIGNKLISTMDKVSQYGIASGLELLKRLDINIYDEKDRIVGLPANRRSKTGIISFSAYNPIDTLVTSDTLDSSFIFKISVHMCGHLAQILKAQGPTLHINAGCASTLYAIDLANLWLRSNKCEDVILIGADHSGSSTLFPYIAGGFAKEKIATLDTNISNAVQSFGCSRSGVIIGSGCMSMMMSTRLPKKKDIVRVENTFVYNTGYHISALHTDLLSERLKEFVLQTTQKLNMSIEDFSKQVLYFSHETSSPKCAETEIECLRHVFGEYIKNIIICATKGITGHTMGVSLEDVISLESLVTRRLVTTPTTTLDTSLRELYISRGGCHSRKLVLRFSAGFGSFVGFSVYSLSSSSVKEV